MAHAEKSIVVLTGAGISAESGIPTFRGPDGLWQGRDPQQLATPQAFDRDPALVWRFYEWRRGLIANSQPNAAHFLLAEIEKQIPHLSIITQNVDGYHTQAGNTQLLEIHGSLWRLKCTLCTHKWEDRRYPLPKLPPICPVCEGLARPDVVWFGEALSSEILHSAMRMAMEAQIFLSIGTSSVVYPAAELPLIAKQNGAHVIEINPESTPISGIMDEVLRGPSSIELARWWERFSADLLDMD